MNASDASTQPTRGNHSPGAAQPATGAPLPVEQPQPAETAPPSERREPALTTPPEPATPAPTTVAAIPLVEQRRPLPSPMPLSRPPGRRASPTPILVATAEPALARMLSFALEQMRLPYRLLESGPVVLREMLEMRVTSQPPIVLLDVDLPGVDGHAILERIGLKRPDTFLILVLSSHADESVQVRSLLAGAVDHLAKPFNVRILMAKIQRWNAMAAHLAGAP